MKVKKWLIVDRDGTLIEETHYLHRAEEVTLLPNAASGLALFERYGCGIIVITNQSGIGRGYCKDEDVRLVHGAISAAFNLKGVSIAAYFYCPHRPEDGCSCRKPKIGLVQKAMGDLNFSLGDILCVIGDKECDVAFAQNIGVPSVLVMTGYGRKEYERGIRGDYNVKDLLEAANCVLMKGRLRSNDEQGNLSGKFKISYRYSA